jgi:hypothetical protein
MGPFKHSVDDGLDLRKAAFECMYTLLGSCLDRLDVFEFLRHVEDGLRDHYDIKMLTYLMCARLAQLCPAVVLQREYYAHPNVPTISHRHYYMYICIYDSRFPSVVDTPPRHSHFSKMI